MRPAKARAQGALLVLMLATLLALAFQGSRGLWTMDEQRYSNVAMEMLRLDDFLHPVIHHEHPHYSKPPLIYWAIAASVQLMGRTEWAVRLPNALAFTFTVLLAMAMARRLGTGRPELAGVIQATSVLPFIAANLVTTDTLLALWEALAVYGFVEYRWSAAGRQRWPLYAMWMGFALAFLTKGPPGLLPLAAIVLFVLIDDGVRALGRLFSPIGLLLFFTVGGSWYIAVVLQDPNLLSYFVIDEVRNRVMTSQHSHNYGWLGAFKVYLPTIVVGTLPWAPLGVYRWLAKRRVSKDSRLTPEVRFLLIWLALPLAVFCLAQSRLPLYLVPLSVPFTLLCGYLLKDLAPTRPRLVFLLVWVILLIGLKWMAAVITPNTDPRRLAEALMQSYAGPLKEIVIVDGKRIQGLSFYCDAEVEVVAMLHPGHERRQGLESELLEAETGRVFLVPSEEVSAFAAAVKRTGHEARFLGQYGKTEFYSLADD